jgi:hypothetical protein
VLWRGAKGHERIARKSHIFRAVDGAHTSEVSREAKTREGAKNQYGRQLRRWKDSEDLANPTRVLLPIGDETAAVVSIARTSGAAKA